MIFFPLLFHKVKGDEQTINPSQEACPQPGSYLDEAGKCKCQLGYFGDYPVSDRGCWKCEPRCARYGMCVYPGRCVCKYGLDEPYCTVPNPDIMWVFPVPENMMYPIRVNIVYNTSIYFTPFVSYCKFNGQNTTIGTIYENRTIECDVPKEVKGKSFVQISFNGMIFSQPKEIDIPTGVKWKPPEFEKADHEPELNRTFKTNMQMVYRFSLFIPLLIIFIIIDIVGCYCPKKRGKEKVSDKIIRQKLNETVSFQIEEDGEIKVRNNAVQTGNQVDISLKNEPKHVD